MSPRTPSINVDVQMILVTPAQATGPVPVTMMFGGRGLPALAQGPPGLGTFTPPPGSDPPGTEQLIADGWGYVSMRSKAPGATIIVTAISPQNDNTAVLPIVDRTGTLPRAHYTMRRIGWIAGGSRDDSGACMLARSIAEANER